MACSRSHGRVEAGVDGDDGGGGDGGDEGDERDGGWVVSRMVVGWALVRRATDMWEVR